MKIEKTLIKKEIIPLKNGYFLERITKEIIRDRENLEEFLNKIDIVVNPNFAKTEEAKLEQSNINKMEKECIKKALSGKPSEVIHLNKNK